MSLDLNNTLLDLDTGDLILFSNKSTNWFDPFYYLSFFIDYGTHSDLTHVGMVVKNPDFLENNRKCKDGLYFWESSWEGNGIRDVNDERVKMGVQLVPLRDVLENNRNESNFFIRKLNRHDFKSADLKKINDVVYNKPYDIYPKDWLRALLQKNLSPQRINCFWCSALVGYIYTQLGIIDKDSDWSIMTPDNFSLTGDKLHYINNYKLLPEEIKV